MFALYVTLQIGSPCCSKVTLIATQFLPLMLSLCMLPQTHLRIGFKITLVTVQHNITVNGIIVFLQSQFVCKCFTTLFTQIPDTLMLPLLVQVHPRLGGGDVVAALHVAVELEPLVDGSLVQHHGGSGGEDVATRLAAEGLLDVEVLDVDVVVQGVVPRGHVVTVAAAEVRLVHPHEGAALDQRHLGLLLDVLTLLPLLAILHLGCLGFQLHSRRQTVHELHILGLHLLFALDRVVLQLFDLIVPIHHSHPTQRLKIEVILVITFYLIIDDFLFDVLITTLTEEVRHALTNLQG